MILNFLIFVSALDSEIMGEWAGRCFLVSRTHNMPSCKLGARGTVEHLAGLLSLKSSNDSAAFPHSQLWPSPGQRSLQQLWRNKQQARLTHCFRKNALPYNHCHLNNIGNTTAGGFWEHAGSIIIIMFFCIYLQ